MFVKQRELVVQLCHQAKQDYFKLKLDGMRDQKNFWSAANELLHRGKTRALLFHNSEAALAEWFSNYFHEKVQDLRRGMLDRPEHGNQLVVTDVAGAVPELSQFVPAAEAEISRLIVNATAKMCTLDPLPTGLVKEMRVSLLPSVTSIVNKCLAEGIQYLSNLQLSPPFEETTYRLGVI